MKTSLIAKKCGMSSYREEENVYPITIILVEPNRVVTVKTKEVDGYKAIQVAVGSQNKTRLNKPCREYLLMNKLSDKDKLKNIVEPCKMLRELRLDNAFDLSELKDKKNITVDDLGIEVGNYLDVSGTTKGKGFAGVIKRYNFKMQDATHGNSLSHRAPGSIGQCQTPGRVFKGKKMAGHMGNEKCTVTKLKLLKVVTLKNNEGELLYVKGSVPGKIGGYLTIRRSNRMK
jgi:large subunit ribosomal protein L3